MTVDAFRAAVYRLVRRIPRGRVVTYGQIAGLMGHPRAARAVGAALRTCPAGLPWHRVVNARGGISPRRRLSGMLTQRIRLEQEGVRLRGGRVSLPRHRWAARGAAGQALAAGGAAAREEEP
jgi:methylated-DNA-protein-cysteine methyltransferase-like protein